ncbi:hypothetical protein [Pedobacter caeni]|uniref:Uncharacterized protein n=1 Tax=Pedobacter caeni TaxID=288992 RepID=A0A1M4TBT3_9SPHI|nr:hypothetical protein [Pedobacter caeni]SHE41848.1 hypothetical protein SAMN04488522_101145 [Pedobacter caeni]
MKKVLSGIPTLLLMAVGLSLLTAIFLNNFIIPLFPVLVAVLVIYLTRSKRILLKTKETPISNLTGGLVKIQGTVEAPGILESPFFKEQCVGYNYEKGEVHYYDDGNEQVTISMRKNDFQDFYLMNKTGKIKVIAADLNLSLLPAQIKTIHSLKHTENDIRHTERTLKNGDLIHILGNAIETNHNEFELKALPESPLVISTPAIESHTQKGFRAIRHLLPYIVLIYLAVNYFLFFAPVKVQLGPNKGFIIFSIFGMPVLALIFAAIGSKMHGAFKFFFTSLAGICIIVTLLASPLLCLLHMTKTEFYRMLCIWISIFLCTTIATIMNYNRLDEIFVRDERNIKRN